MPGFIRGTRQLAGRILLVVAVALVAMALQACAATSPRDHEATLIAALTRQADQWDQAIMRKDSAAVAANMAEDFRQIGSSGAVADRAAFLENILSPRLQIDPYTVEDFDVRLYGDVALLSGTTRMTGRYDGEPFTTHYRYIDIYARVRGEWKVVSVQTTKISP